VRYFAKATKTAVIRNGRVIPAGVAFGIRQDEVSAMDARGFRVWSEAEPDVPMQMVKKAPVEEAPIPVSEVPVSASEAPAPAPEVDVAAIATDVLAEPESTVEPKTLNNNAAEGPKMGNGKKRAQK